MTESSLTTTPTDTHPLSRRASRLAHRVATGASALKQRLPKWARSRAAARTGTVLLALAALNITAHLFDLDAKLVIPLGAALLAAAAWASGLRSRALGVHRDHARHGLRVALWCAGITAAVLAIALLIPQTAQFFHDNRYADASDVAMAAFILIPLTTVIPEELAFRGVLDGALTEHLGERGAYIVGALAFGAWHVLTTGAMTSGNTGLATLLGTGPLAQVVSILGVVAATSVAGLGFIWLRRRTGSLLAPMGMHWALNGLAAIATRIATHPPF
ncbi:MAG: lysostaphin resistance A-like protein [Cumulibacter sp.]